MFLASCISLTYMVYGKVHEFKLHQIRLKVNQEDSLTLPFPTLTICDTDLLRDQESLQILNNGLPKSCEDNQVNKTTDQFFLNGCKQFMSKVELSCSYGGQSKCCFPGHFTPSHNWKQCYTLNYNGTLVQPTPGRYGGLNLLMFKNSSIGGRSDNLDNPFQETRRGLQLQIHGTNTFPNQMLMNPIPLTPGYQVQVVIKKKVYKRLPAPFPSKCSNITPVKQFVSGKYTTSNCKISCFIQRMYDYCGGILHAFKVLVPKNEYPNTEKYKDEDTLVACVTKLYTTHGFVNCDCPMTCEEEIFESQVTLTPWQKSSIIKRIHPQIARQLSMPKDDVNLETWRESIVLLSVFYEEFTTQYVTEQELYSMSSLASDIGGLLGLCIGASVISICELIYLSFHGLHDKKFKRKSSVKQETNVTVRSINNLP
eukprot:gene14950-16492_t